MALLAAAARALSLASPCISLLLPSLATLRQPISLAACDGRWAGRPISSSAQGCMAAVQGQQASASPAATASPAASASPATPQDTGPAAASLSTPTEAAAGPASSSGEQQMSPSPLASQSELPPEPSLEVPKAVPEKRIVSVLPGWLRSLLPGGQHMVSKPGGPAQQKQDQTSTRPATAASDSGAAAPASSAQVSAEDTKRKEYIDYLEMHKDLTVDGFVELNKQLWMNSEPPVPRVLRLPRSHPDFRRFIDWKRVSYLRTLQHEKIGSVLTDVEKARIKAEKMDVLKDRAFIKAIAKRTGVYIDAEVRDCIKGFLETSDHMRRLHRWSVVAGNPEPKNAEEQKQALDMVKEVEELEEQQKKRETQDRLLCPVLPLLGFLGPDATCSRTGLKYHQCCGISQGEDIRRALEGRKQAKELKGLRGRKVPRSERAVLKLLRERKEANKWDAL